MKNITVHIHTCMYVFVYIQCINVYISLYIKNSKKKLVLIFGPLNIPSPSYTSGLGFHSRTHLALLPLNYKFLYHLYQNASASTDEWTTL